MIDNLSAPSSWLKFCADIETGRDQPEPHQLPFDERSYRLRVRYYGGPTSHYVDMVAASADDAAHKLFELQPSVVEAQVIGETPSDALAPLRRRAS